MGRELGRNIPVVAQPQRAAVQERRLEAVIPGDLHGAAHLGGGVPEGLVEEFQGQALAGIAEGGSRLGGELVGEFLARGAEAVGPARTGVLHDGAERVAVAQALEDTVPEGDERGEGPLVEGEVALGQPGGQQGDGQELVELAQQLGRRKAGAQQRRLGRREGGPAVWGAALGAGGAGASGARG
jgi:hypothetical protein